MESEEPPAGLFGESQTIEGGDVLAAMLAAHITYGLKQQLGRTISLGPYYVQWAVEPGILQAEAVSDTFLAAEDQITAFGAARMRQLGFAEPSSDSPNWSMFVRDEFGAFDAGTALATAILEVYRVGLGEALHAVGRLPDDLTRPPTAEDRARLHLVTPVEATPESATPIRRPQPVPHVIPRRSDALFRVRVKQSGSPVAYIAVSWPENPGDAPRVVIEPHPNDRGVQFVLGDEVVPVDDTDTASSIWERIGARMNWLHDAALDDARAAHEGAWPQQPPGGDHQNVTIFVRAVNSAMYQVIEDPTPINLDRWTDQQQPNRTLFAAVVDAMFNDDADLSTTQQVTDPVFNPSTTEDGAPSTAEVGPNEGTSVANRPPFDMLFHVLDRRDGTSVAEIAASWPVDTEELPRVLVQPHVNEQGLRFIQGGHLDLDHLREQDLTARIRWIHDAAVTGANEIGRLSRYSEAERRSVDIFAAIADPTLFRVEPEPTQIWFDRWTLGKDAPTAQAFAPVIDRIRAAQGLTAEPHSDVSVTDAEGDQGGVGNWPLSMVYLVGEPDPGSWTAVKNVWGRLAVRYVEDLTEIPAVAWLPLGDRVDGPSSPTRDDKLVGDVLSRERHRQEISRSVATDIRDERLTRGDGYPLTWPAIHRIVKNHLSPAVDFAIGDGGFLADFDAWVSEQQWTWWTELQTGRSATGGTPPSDPESHGGVNATPSSHLPLLLTRPEPNESREEFTRRVAAVLGIKPSQTLDARAPTDTDWAKLAHQAASEAGDAGPVALTKGAVRTASGDTARDHGDVAADEYEEAEEALGQLLRVTVDPSDTVWESWEVPRARGTAGVIRTDQPGELLPVRVTVEEPGLLEVSVNLGEFYLDPSQLDDLAQFDTHMVSVFSSPSIVTTEEPEDPDRYDQRRPVRLGARSRIDLTAATREVPLPVITALVRRAGVAVLLHVHRQRDQQDGPRWLGGGLMTDFTSIASLLDLAYPLGLAREVRASFTESFGAANLGTAWIPRALAPDVVLEDKWMWSAHASRTSTTDHRRVEAYRFGPMVEAAIRDWTPRYQLCHAGHGINSYALCYEWVGPRVSVIALRGWGGIYMDPDQTPAGIRLLNADLSLLEALASAIADWEEGNGRLTVWTSEFMPSWGWTWQTEPRRDLTWPSIVDEWERFHPVRADVTDDLGTSLGPVIRLLEFDLSTELGFPGYDD